MLVRPVLRQEAPQGLHDTVQIVVQQAEQFTKLWRDVTGNLDRRVPARKFLRVEDVVEVVGTVRESVGYFLDAPFLRVRGSKHTQSIGKLIVVHGLARVRLLIVDQSSLADPASVRWHPAGDAECS